MSRNFVLAAAIIIVFFAQAQSQNYEVAKTITKVKGTIKILEDKETVVIVPADNASGRYIAANLPGDFKKDGMKVVVSGDVGKIPPNVRMMGTPLKLKMICVSKSEQQKFKLKKRVYKFK